MITRNQVGVHWCNNMKHCACTCMPINIYSLIAGPNLYRGTLQQKGMAMVPKRALVVMGCEIARLLQLTQNAIVPISFCIQRKVLPRCRLS